MTRRKFLQDLKQAKQNPPAHITDVELHEDDGLRFTYLYQVDNVQKESCLVLITTNVDEYPFANGFIIYADDESKGTRTDTVILNALEHLQAIIDSLPVIQALEEISGGLHQVLTAGLAENPIVLNSDIDESQVQAQEDAAIKDNQADVSDFDDCDDNSDEDFGFDGPKLLRLTLSKERSKPSSSLIPTDLTKMKIDLRYAKQSGFRVGIYGDLEHGNGIICVSIRIAKLGISEEAMQAWGVSKQQYLVLMIRFLQGYRDLATISEDRNLIGKVDMRVGLCRSYKPRNDEAVTAFTQQDTLDGESATQPVDLTQPKVHGAFEPLFIGRSINELLRDRFAQIVKYRSWGLTWPGAEHCYNNAQGAADNQLPKDLKDFDTLDDQLDSRALPEIVKEDSLRWTDIKQASLPLVAMQFVLRHFVRCTEFCLVCHCQVSNSFEALKPYVCSKPLCLFQFLALGFGPSIEWEIMSQPYVVDLLVSLCYVQAKAQRLKELPLGIGLKVPLLPEYASTAPVVHYGHGLIPPVAPAVAATIPPIHESFKAILNPETNTLEASTSPSNTWPQLRGGEWLAVVLGSPPSGTRHFRVRNIVGTKIYLDSEIRARRPSQGGPPPDLELPVDVSCFLYDVDFDTLPKTYQYHAITAMLDTLPPVPEMRRQLKQHLSDHRDPLLNLLVEIPPVARDLLRWIIASNRSCIMQVDTVWNKQTTSKTDELQASEPRVSGMNDWMQFRFAQGAPDKEQRFIDCVKDTTAKKPYPTLFAWHGSPLHNWHSIIRQGLNFDEIMHGRATGHGVYMSTHLQTSLGYSGMNYGPQEQWSGSELKVTMVVSLQEVVNATDKFVSKQPHFVVAQKDWIQTRYLFVKTSVNHSTGNEPKTAYVQDPAHPLSGSSGGPIQIPINAVSKSRRLEDAASPSNSKKPKMVEPEDANDADDLMSDSTIDEDRRMIEFGDDDDDIPDFSDSIDVTDTDDFEILEVRNKPVTAPPSPTNGRKRKSDSDQFTCDPSMTDFLPGTLNTENIQFFPPPVDATPAATRALLKAFNETIKTQETTPLHELGFYIDPDRMENMYQWIVELHSFDSTLPLAKDMKAGGVKSVVLEMRFTPDYPFSPPFVRVVKPQFLPFMNGGGGHVTEGGAICMELLTSTGWSVVSSIESVLLQIRLALSEKERPARLLTTGRHGRVDDTCYKMGQAVEAFKRACMKHGWKAPGGIDKLL